MNLIALNIPETHAELGRWLEQTMLGPDLAVLIAELSAVHGVEGRSATSLSSALDNQLQQVLAKGLGGLPQQVLRRLLREPRLLLDLQEAVLTSGGQYWDHLSSGMADEDRKVELGWRNLRRTVESQAKKARTETHVLRFEPKAAWSRRSWTATFALAAAILVAAFLFRDVILPTPQPAAAAGWGWSKSGALAQNVTADEYFSSLADSAKEWFNKRPDKSADLAKRLSELRQGCSTLILAEHRPLAATDRQWLTERCRAWAEKLDQHLKSVEAGDDPLKVRAQADETVNKLVAALQTRAQGLKKA